MVLERRRDAPPAPHTYRPCFCVASPIPLYWPTLLDGRAETSIRAPGVSGTEAQIPTGLDVVVGAAQTGGAHPDAATVGTEIDGDGRIGAEHLALHGVLASRTPRGALRRPARATRS